MVMATKRAVVMATKVVGEDAGDGDGTKRAIARKRAMAGPIYKINKILCQCPQPTHCKDKAARGWLLIP
jgi:hypothetical protein